MKAEMSKAVAEKWSQRSRIKNTSLQNVRRKKHKAT
jgi:hypothetical protein